MSDPRWLAEEGWVKMQHNVKGIVIHYVYNPLSGAVDDFKFKAVKRARYACKMHRERRACLPAVSEGQKGIRIGRITTLAAEPARRH